MLSVDSSDNYLVKMDSSYNVDWIRQASGPSSMSIPDLAVDNAGYAYLTSYFAETVNFGAGTPTFTNVGNRDSYITKWSPIGDLAWARQIEGGDATNRILGIDFDLNNNPYFIGYFGGTVDFDLGAGTVNRTSAGAQNDFLLSLTADGEFQNVQQIQRGSGLIKKMTLDSQGNLYLIGGFSSTVTLPNGDMFVNVEGGQDSYLLKLILAPGITVSPSVGLTTGENGNSAAFSMVLDMPPTADVTVALASSDASEGTVAPASLTFTPSNWNVPQTVTVTGADDTLLDGDVAYTIITGAATSADPGYQGLNPADVTVTNQDDDQPIVLFADSFENGQWNGKWVEDSQNDWFTSTQRSTDGNYSAEVDGRSSNATLTTASPIDLTPYGTVELSFSWYIESRLDKGEYLALDLYNGSWQNDVAILRGNVDQENVWHQETIAVDGSYLVDNFQFRFRSKASRSNEDANVDNVQLVATSFAVPPNALPVAVADAYSLDEDSSLSVLAATGLLLNDSDADGDALTAVLASGPANGALSLNADGSFTYLPGANFNGTDSFTYRATDGLLESNTATVSITVNSINDAPVASADSYTTDQDTPLNVTAAGVLANDSDADGDGLTAVLVVASGPQNGTLSLSADGSFSYTPDSGFNGSDSFSYRANDGALDSNTATVSITVNRVNQLPVATDEAYSTAEDTPLNVSAPGVLVGDSDADSDPLTAVLVNGPSAGVLTLNSDGSFTYTPAANFNGSDSFSYVANDGIGNSNVATVGLTIDPVNDAPVAVADAYTVDQDTTLNIAPTGILANDTDVEGNSLTAVQVTGPANGVLLLNLDGSFDYTPDAGFIGTDNFTYLANDGAVDSSAAAQVTLDVQSVASGPKLATGVVTNVSSNWQTVNLVQTYTSMVVIATPNYAAGDAPAVVRIQNAAGSRFEVRVDPAGGGAVGNVGVNYVVVEEGVYDEPGYKLEAVKYNSTVTDENNSWKGESRSYQQAYAAPVVVGQVMTTNDADWSVFWAAGSSRTKAPSSTALTVGKHVGEDANASRANETIGYLVLETSTGGSGQIEGLPYVAGVGADSIKGVGDAPGYSYGVPASLNAQTAVVSQAAMDGGNGGWAMLYGSNPVDSVGNTLNLAIDEDQAKDTERRHTTEQVAYLVFGTPAAAPSAGAGADQAFTTTPVSPKREHTRASVQDQIFSSIEFRRVGTQLPQPADHFQYRFRGESTHVLETVVDDTEAFVEAMDRAFETAFGSH